MNFSGDILALAGLIIALFVWLRSDIKDVRERIDGLADRVSRPEGLIEGLLRPRPVIAPNAPD